MISDRMWNLRMDVGRKAFICVPCVWVTLSKRNVELCWAACLCSVLCVGQRRNSTDRYWNSVSLLRSVTVNDGIIQADFFYRACLRIFFFFKEVFLPNSLNTKILSVGCNVFLSLHLDLPERRIPVGCKICWHTYYTAWGTYAWGKLADLCTMTVFRAADTPTARHRSQHDKSVLVPFLKSAHARIAAWDADRFYTWIGNLLWGLQPLAEDVVMWETQKEP